MKQAAIATVIAALIATHPFAAAKKASHAHSSNEVLVKLKRPLEGFERALLEHNIDADDIQQLAGAIHKFHSRSLDTDALLQMLRLHDAVEYVEPNYQVEADVTPTDPLISKLWGMPKIHADTVWNTTTGSRANVVAVIDTGIDYTHPDLAANMWKAPSAFTVTIGGVAITCASGTHGFNAIARTCDPRDDHYHGTHVAGTIGAVGNNAAGVAGANWTTSLMGIKFLDSTGSGYVSDAINGIEFAIQAKHAFGSSAAANVRVLSNSWGGAPFSQALLDEIGRANSNDMLFVVAAGNSASNNDVTPTYPANYAAPNVISVAATDSNDQLASFSNYGSSSVQLAAPGVQILSTTPGNQYAYLSGTSMATPHVSGAAALVLSKCALSTSALRSTLLSHVDVLGSVTGDVQTNGRLNVAAAINACAAVPAAPANLKATTGSTKGQISLTWSAVSGAASYRLKRSMLSTGPFSTIQTLTGKTTYVNAGLTSGKTYYYIVTATNGSGESAASNKTSAAAK